MIGWKKKVGQPDAGTDMVFHFGQLIAHAAKTRNLRAGSIVGSGTVSNKDAKRGYCCIAEKRCLETIEHGAPQTEFMRYGDTVRIERHGRQVDLRRNRAVGRAARRRGARGAQRSAFETRRRGRRTARLATSNARMPRERRIWPISPRSRHARRGHSRRRQGLSAGGDLALVEDMANDFDVRAACGARRATSSTT